MSLNETEQARRSSLRQRGIGSSLQAIKARRTREVMARLRQIERGERLPGWMSIPGLATPERVDEFLSQLDPRAKEKAIKLISDRNKP